MSELKAHRILGMNEECASVENDYYLKAEADKVISDLKRLNHDLCERVTENDEIRQHWEEIEQTMAENAMLKAKLADKDKEIVRQKYKRCLAMASSCSDKASAEYASSYVSCDEYYYHHAEFWEKWHKRWLELAEKFKEDK